MYENWRDLVEIIDVQIRDKTLKAFRTILPGNEDRGEMYLFKGELGYAMCAIMHESRVNDSGACAFVIPAYTIEEALESEITFVTEKATLIGINVGMKGKEGLYKLCQ